MADSQTIRTHLRNGITKHPCRRKLCAAAMSVHGMPLWSSEFSIQQHEGVGESGALLLEIYEQARLSLIKPDYGYRSATSTRGSFS